MNESHALSFSCCSQVTNFGHSNVTNLISLLERHFCSVSLDKWSPVKWSFQLLFCSIVVFSVWNIHYQEDAGFAFGYMCVLANWYQRNHLLYSLEYSLVIISLIWVSNWKMQQQKFLKHEATAIKALPWKSMSSLLQLMWHWGEAFWEWLERDLLEAR